MEFIAGFRYQWRGLMLALKTPRLLILGLVRFVVVIGITVLAAGLVLAYQQEIVNAVWSQPDSPWVRWLWHLVSWLLTLLLLGISSVAGYLVAQIFFCVLIMDWMSRITERLVSGSEKSPAGGFWSQFFFLLRQEIPRNTLPMLLLLVLTVVGWLTPLGPVIALATSVLGALFLAWDNTDLVPARRMQPFGRRFSFLTHTLPFHLGFGLPLLIPVVNILLLSYAPVGATLYYIERREDGIEGVEGPRGRGAE